MIQATNLILALATFLTAITALVKVWKTKTKVETSVRKLANVEKLVNGKHDAALARIDQLGETLVDAGIPIPPREQIGNNDAL